MAAEDSQRCAWPPCGRLVERPATGRPGRYCGSNCRQSDYRERVRQAGAEQDRAAQLARAEAEAAVVAYASGPADTRAGLADVLYRLRAAAGQLEGGGGRLPGRDRHGRPAYRLTGLPAYRLTGL